MNIQLLDQEIYLIQEQNHSFARVDAFVKESRFMNNPYSIICQLETTAKDLDFSALEIIQSKLEELNLILVLLVQGEILNQSSDSFIQVPTLEEAIDYIHLDRIQKELLD